MVEEVVRHRVLFPPLIIYKYAKEERCINASVDDIVAINVCGVIEHVRNVRRAVDAANMILEKQD